jgi:hypothetical protein
MIIPNSNSREIEIAFEVRSLGSMATRVSVAIQNPYRSQVNWCFFREFQRPAILCLAGFAEVSPF